jgi:hypothetical protein
LDKLRGRGTDWVRKCTELVVDGKRPKGRPRRTWGVVVKDDMKRMNAFVTK